MNKAQQLHSLKQLKQRTTSTNSVKERYVPIVISNKLIFDQELSIDDVKTLLRRLPPLPTLSALSEIERRITISNDLYECDRALTNDLPESYLKRRIFTMYNK